MEKVTTIGKLGSYVKLNWHKFFLLGIIAFAFAQKDFSFQLDLQSPFRPEKEEKRLSNPPPVTKGKKVKPPSQDKALLEIIGFPFFHNDRKAFSLSDAFENADDAVVEAYIKRFAHVAVNEQKKFGIPASLILANALLQSTAGQRELAARGNNHFGLPCASSWQGETIPEAEKCFRKYPTAWISFRDHSLYLSSGKLAPLRSLGPIDYKAWAKALEKEGFSDTPRLASSLIKIIEDRSLNKYDVTP